MEFKKDTSFFSGRIKSIGFAVQGALKLLTTEHSIMAQTAVFIFATFLGFYYSISSTEWMIQIIVFGLVLSVEGLNTATEKMADFIHPEFHERIGFIKDIAAGAVFFAALTAFSVLCVIYIPKF